VTSPWTDAVENLGTIYHYAYDATGNRTDVVFNGVLDTHQEFDAANQVLAQVYDVAGNVISDTAPFAVDDCLALRCTSSTLSWSGSYTPYPPRPRRRRALWPGTTSIPRR
jgi:YD repeat-containing protein